MNDLEQTLSPAFDRLRALLARTDLTPVALLQQLTQALAPAQVRVVEAFVIQRGGLIVQGGPFAGMRVLATSAEGAVVPKLLGCYESELHPTIQSIVATAPTKLVNIGSGDGYYAIGLARLLPNLKVHAFDLNAAAQATCMRLANENGVGDRVIVGGECTHQNLQALCEPGTVVLCDCEGAERELMDPAKVSNLKGCRVIIECHDFLDATISPTLARRFEPTHGVTLVPNAWTNPNTIPLLRSLHPVQRCLAVWEGRPGLTPWLDLKSR